MNNSGNIKYLVVWQSGDINTEKRYVVTKEELPALIQSIFEIGTEKFIPEWGKSVLVKSVYEPPHGEFGELTNE